MHLAAARYLKGIGSLALFYPQGNVLQQFPHQPIAEMAGGDKLTLAPCKGAVVDHKVHFQGRFADLDERQRFGGIGGAKGLADGDIFDARKAYNVAHLGFGDGDTD